MNKRMMPLLVVAMAAASCSNRDVAAAQVPSVVRNTLTANYPAASDVEWEKHNGYYEAELHATNNGEITVRIDEAGKLMMRKQDVSVQELPAAMQATMQNQYKDYRIDDVDKIEKDGIVYYQAELDSKGKSDIKRVFTAEGQDENTIAYWD